jgi:hypothetical protein
MIKLGKLAALLLGSLLAINALAADKQLRIGTLATKNSLYHRQLMEVGEAWRTAQGAGAAGASYVSSESSSSTVSTGSAASSARRAL